MPSIDHCYTNLFIEFDQPSTMSNFSAPRSGSRNNPTISSASVSSSSDPSPIISTSSVVNVDPRASSTNNQDFEDRFDNLESAVQDITESIESNQKITGDAMKSLQDQISQLLNVFFTDRDVDEEVEVSKKAGLTGVKANSDDYDSDDTGGLTPVPRRKRSRSTSSSNNSGKGS